MASLKLTPEENSWWHTLSQAEQQRLEVGRRVSARTVMEIHRAQDSFLLLDTQLKRLATSRAVRGMLVQVGPSGLKTINSALYANVVLGILRTTENPQSESLSACVISPMLFVDEHVHTLTSDVWLRHQQPFGSDLNRFSEQHERIEWFKAVVPSGWGSKVMAPEKNYLANARQKLRDVRDRVLAHAMETGRLAQPTPDDIRSALKISIEVAEAASQMYLRKPSGLDRLNHDRFDKFWECVESGARAMKAYGYEDS